MGLQGNFLMSSLTFIKLNTVRKKIVDFEAINFSIF